MNIAHFVFSPVILPLLGAALAFFAKAFFKSRWALFWEYTGIFIGLFLPWLFLFLLLPSLIEGDVYQGIVGGWYKGVGIAYRFDGLAWLVNFLGFSVACAAWIYSLGAGPRGPQFSSIFLIQTAALAATAMTADLFNLFVCLEVMGLASYILVAYSGKPGAFLASFSYLMVSATAMIFFLLGIYGFYRLTGNLSYEGISQGLSALENGGGTIAQISLALIVAAVALRVAVMPLYGWLPDAHAMAPHAISAVLSGVLIKTPLFALSRVLLIMPSGAQAGQLLGIAGAITALAAVIIALSQKDAKRLLAYHSISQIGYVVCAWGIAMHIGLSTPAGSILMTAAFLHALYHALFKGLLFLSVGTVTDSGAERDVYKLRRGAALLRRSGEFVPVTLITFTLAALAISAIPPMNGFASKAAISYALKGRWEYILLTLAGIGTVASFIKLSRIFWPKRKKAITQSQKFPDTSKAGWQVKPSMLIAEIILGALCLAGGLAAPAISRFAGNLLKPEGANFTINSIPPVLYSLDTLAKTGLITAAGVVLFLLCITPTGGRILKVIRERPRSFHGLFLSLALGIAGMAAWLTL